MKIKNNDAQVTLFVILSVIIIISVISFFLLKPYIKLGDSTTSNPEAYLEKCVGDSLKKTEQILIDNNLKTNQNFSNYYFYKSEKVPFLCTSFEFYMACIPQEPALFTTIKNYLENRALVDLQNCYNILNKDFRSKGYSVSESNLSLNISLSEKLISVYFKKDFIVSKGEDTSSIGKIEFVQPSVIYDLIKTAQTIVNYESTVCEFNEVNWMMAMHDVLISKFVGSDSTKVYTLKDRYSDKEIKFAIKSCVMPAGL